MSLIYEWGCDSPDCSVVRRDRHTRWIAPSPPDFWKTLGDENRYHFCSWPCVLAWISMEMET